MTAWLSNHIESLSLPDELEGYLYGRGMTEEDITSFGVKEWQLLPEDSPSQSFNDKYGSRGENLRGLLCVPAYNARGGLLGAEFRSYKGSKKVLQFRFPEADWQATFLGIRGATELLWAGGDPWIFEGLFDVAPMRLVLPRSPLLGTYRARFSDLHFEHLKRHMRPGAIVNFAYDNDEAGRKATKFAIHRLEKEGIRAIERRYTMGKDPGEIWDKLGVEGLREAFDL